MTERPTYRLTDPAALEALAHPLRNRLLGLLRTDGPATASGLAERVGESSGVTSYHLRKLAEVGFVEEEADRGTRRERWWRSVHSATSWSPSDFLGNPEAHRASVSLRREWYRWQQRLLDRWMEEERECLVNLLSVYVAHRGEKDAVDDDRLNRLEAIAKDHLLDALIIYELASRVSPQVVLTLSDEERSRVRTYVEKYVLTRVAPEGAELHE